MTEYQEDYDCPNCGRTVKEINVNLEKEVCLFCLDEE
jgi:hypothetical protein